MKRRLIALAIPALGLAWVAGPMSGANGADYSYRRAPAYYGGNIEPKPFYPYVLGQTTTFYSEYRPGYGYTHGSTTINYNAHAPYPYGSTWMSRRPWPSGPAASW
jgi:hypothetical protein